MDMTLLEYKRANPFRPFRIVMNNGRTYDVKHPDFIAVGMEVGIFYHQKSPDGPFERWESFSLGLVNHVEHIHAEAKPA